MKNLKKAIVMVLSFAMLSSSMSFAKGIGVGNGGNSDRDRYLNRLRVQFGDKLAVGSATKAQDVYSWCSRVSAILKKELRKARIKMSRGEDNWESAYQMLIYALIAAGESMSVDPSIGGPMTKRLVDRGLIISEALDNHLNQGTLRELTSKLDFIEQYVQFIIDSESEFDTPWYIPYRYRHAGCYSKCRMNSSPHDKDCRLDQDMNWYGECWSGCAPDFNFRKFQESLVAYGQKQLNFVAQNFTDLKRSRGQVTAVPVGNANAFLKVAELVSGFVAFDLSSNLYANANACTVRDLSILASDLFEFNDLGDRSVYPSVPWAVAEVYDEFTRHANSLSSCMVNR